MPLFDSDIKGFLNPRHADWRRAKESFSDLRAGDIDLVFGGPPCQGFSQIGTRMLDDPRNRLYLEFARVVRSLRPKVILMENVPNMLLMSKGVFRDEILQHLRSIGYRNTDVRLVSASHYGVPQERRRAIFFGVRDDLRFPVDAGAWLDHVLASQRRPQATVSMAIGDLPERVGTPGKTLRYPKTRLSNELLNELRLDRDGYLYKSDEKRELAGGLVLHNHHTKEIQERRKHLISHLKPGMKADSLPKELWDGLRPEKWRRLHPERPAYTILAQMHRDLSEWVHPQFERWITVREAARLQSFHDGFVFESSEWQMLKQIGNAVPPLLGRAIAIAAQRALDVIAGRDLDIDESSQSGALPLRLAI